MDALMIRRCRSEDLGAITAIYSHYVENGTASFEIAPPDETEMRRRWSSLLENSYPYYVAELGGELCGYSYAGPYRPRPAYTYTVESSVYVAEHAHRRGVGKALLRTLLQACTDLGKRQNGRHHRQLCPYRIHSSARVGGLLAGRHA